MEKCLKVLSDFKYALDCRILLYAVLFLPVIQHNHLKKIMKKYSIVYFKLKYLHEQIHMNTNVDSRMRSINTIGEKNILNRVLDAVSFTTFFHHFY